MPCAGRLHEQRRRLRPPPALLAQRQLWLSPRKSGTPWWREECGEKWWDELMSASHSPPGVRAPPAFRRAAPRFRPSSILSPPGLSIRLLCGHSSVTAGANRSAGGNRRPLKCSTASHAALPAALPARHAWPRRSRACRLAANQSGPASSRAVIQADSLLQDHQHAVALTLEPTERQPGGFQPPVTHQSPLEMRRPRTSSGTQAQHREV